ncbi:MAG: Gfo/Idh/MocA family protein [Eubacteriales bacterium]
MIRFGIMGTGSIAQTMAGAIMHTAETELYAVGSRNLKSAEKFADAHNIHHAYASYEELCCDKDVDIIYIATPHGRHYEDVMTALTHNKHVLCEKAFTLNSLQAKTLVNYAREHKLFLCEAMWTRFIPATKKAAQWLSEGQIGEVRYSSAELGFIAGQDFSHRLLDLKLGGGALLDVGVYSLAFSSFAYNAEKPRFITADSRFFLNEADSLTTVLLGYKTGNAAVSCSLDTNMNCHGIIYGTKGRIEFYDNFMAPRKVILHTKNEAEEFIQQFDYSGHEFQIKACSDAVSAGRLECDEMPLDETVRIMEIIDEIKNLTGLKYPQD